MLPPSLRHGRPPRLVRAVILPAVLVLGACKAEPTGVLPTSIGAGGSPGNGAMSPPPSEAIVDVSIQDFSFALATITVKAGATVRWTNHGPSQHTTTSDGGFWGSALLSPPNGMGSGMGFGGMGGSGMGGAGMGGGMGSDMAAPGGSFELTFSKPGTYQYHCTMHPPSTYPGFIGVVVVMP